MKKSTTSPRTAKEIRDDIEGVHKTLQSLNQKLSVLARECERKEVTTSGYSNQNAWNIRLCQLKESSEFLEQAIHELEIISGENWSMGPNPEASKILFYKPDEEVEILDFDGTWITGILRAGSAENYLDWSVQAIDPDTGELQEPTLVLNWLQVRKKQS